MGPASAMSAHVVMIRPKRRSGVPRDIPDAGTAQAVAAPTPWVRTGRADTGVTGPEREAEILARIRHDPEAFGELYDLHCGAIYAYVYRRLRDRSAAEDVTAEVFVKALRAIDGYRPSAAPFAAWLYRIAANAVVDHHRARRATVSLDLAKESVDLARSVEEQAISRVEADRVWSAIDTLTDAQRTAMTLRFADDLPLAQIGQRMNRSEGAVKLLLHRAMDAIRTHVDAHGSREEGGG
jgi:RNA polymerase sigma-70 factor, ECF subfamily